MIKRALVANIELSQIISLVRDSVTERQTAGSARVVMSCGEYSRSENAFPISFSCGVPSSKYWY